jgi:hypothetical protein
MQNGLGKGHQQQQAEITSSIAPGCIRLRIIEAICRFSREKRLSCVVPGDVAEACGIQGYDAQWKRVEIRSRRLQRERRHPYRSAQAAAAARTASSRPAANASSGARATLARALPCPASGKPGFRCGLGPGAWGNGSCFIQPGSHVATVRRRSLPRRRRQRA